MDVKRLLRGNRPEPQDVASECVTAACLLLADGRLFAHSPAPVALVRRDGTIIAANRAADKIGALLKDNQAFASRIAETIDSETARREIFTFGKLQQEAKHDSVWDLLLLPMPGKTAALVQGYDLTKDHTLRDALVDSRQRYKDLVEISSDFVWEVGAGGRFAFVSPGGALGYTAEQLVDRDPAEFLPTTGPIQAATPFNARTPVTQAELWFRRADGSNALLLVSAIPIHTANGTWTGVRGVCRDITQERERDLALAAAQTREGLLAYIIRCMHDEVNPANMLNAAAQATARALGAVHCRVYCGDGADGFTLGGEFGTAAIDDPLEQSLMKQAAQEGTPVMATDADRHLICIATTYRKDTNGAISITRAQEAGAWTGEEVDLGRDVALQLAIAIEQMDYHDKLEELSRTDELTGLLNRRAFLADLETRLERSDPRPGAGALFYVDLDNFKMVNDLHGHQRGDEALIAVSAILTANSRPGDLVGRLGGDEFALWFDRTDEAASAPRAQELLDAARALRVFSGDQEHPLGMSIGIAPWSPEKDESVASLTERADAAMYEIKHGSKSGYVVAPPKASDAKGEENDPERMQA